MGCVASSPPAEKENIVPMSLSPCMATFAASSLASCGLNWRCLRGGFSSSLFKLRAEYSLRLPAGRESDTNGLRHPIDLRNSIGVVCTKSIKFQISIAFSQFRTAT